MRTISSHDFPVPPDADGLPAGAGLVAGPGADTITVWTGTGADRRTWTWRLGRAPRLLAIPRSFRPSWDLHWSPDGRSLTADLWGRPFLQVWRPSTGHRRQLPVPGRYHGGWIEGWSTDGGSILVHAGVCTDSCTPRLPRTLLSIPVEGGPPRRVRPGDRWYRWVADGRRLQLRHSRDRGRRVDVAIPPGVRLVDTSSDDDRVFWVLGNRRGNRVLLRYLRPWADSVQRPRVVRVPVEVTWVNDIDRGWVRVAGERTLGCGARDGIVDPAGLAVHWVGGCRSIQLVLPAPRA